MLKTRVQLFLNALRIAAAEFQSSHALLSQQRDYPLEKAVALFRANPLRWFHGNPGQDVWPDEIINDAFCTPPNIQIHVGSHIIGWVEGIHIDVPRRIARIRHLAVAEGLENQGLGVVIAHALRLGLVANYRVHTIVFAEDSTRYEEAGYSKFFSKLGAHMIIEQPGWRPAWYWY